MTTDGVQSVSMCDDEVVVVGSGIGGLVCALSLAPKSVTLITKTLSLHGGSSEWAQGGIAAAIGSGDSPEAHASDTLSAGAGLSDPERTLALTKAGAASLAWLIQQGVEFDRLAGGALALAKEAAHGCARVAHAGGDATGRKLMQALIARVQNTSSIKVSDNTLAVDLLVSRGRVQGLLAFHARDGWVLHRTRNVVLATGGIGRAYANTTNPVEATGDGLAIAARAGATLNDLEFVQFHPTALARNAEGGASLPLLTEALRGAGAILVDASGTRFMQTEHPLAELAPRDIVARAIQRKLDAGEGAFLDMRSVFASAHASDFPQAFTASQAAGFDPRIDVVPVAPAAHYHMGGIQADGCGRSSIAGLWACGEVATTGVHGANRLASNSLLEAVVYARLVAAQLGSEIAKNHGRCRDEIAIPNIPSDSSRLQHFGELIRNLMTDHVGVVRTGEGLVHAFDALSNIEGELTGIQAQRTVGNSPAFDDVRSWCELRNLCLVSRLVALSALQREESRGAHFREDFPEVSLACQKQSTQTLHTLVKAQG